MTVTSNESLDAVFKVFDKDAARKAQEAQPQTSRQLAAAAAWEHFRDEVLQDELNVFSGNVVAREGRMQYVSNDKNSSGVQLFSISGRSLAEGVTLQFRFVVEHSTIAAEIKVGDRRKRHEAVGPEEATREWVIRWVRFLLEDFLHFA